MMQKLNRYFDHTLLKPDATREDIAKLCKEAVEYDFYSVCVNSYRVRTACEELMKLRNQKVKVTSVVGFPLGAMNTDAKSQETIIACDDGADEIDMVLNIGALKDKNYEDVLDDIVCVVNVAAEYDVIVKVIIETCLLTDDEIVKACELSMKAGADFVKTSTGFSTGGADVNAIKLMRETIKDSMMIKASGGIRTLDMARKMINAGADRIGASASVEIMKEYAEKQQ